MIAYNDVGIVLFGSAPDNTFSANDFTGNLATLHTVGKVSTNWAAAGVGNYYSDYSGYDLDGDGKGDVPHPLQDAFEYLEGNHPLLRLYLKSAVADALVLAERAFPLLPSSDQYDDKPLLKPGSGMRVEGALAQLDRRGATLALLLSLLALGVTSVAYWRFAR